MNEIERHQLSCEFENARRIFERIEALICPTSESNYLSQSEASAALGVSRHTLARWNVPSIVYGRTRRYRWDDLVMMHRMKRGHAPTATTNNNNNNHKEEEATCS